MPRFVEVYGDALNKENDHYYCISSEDSLTSADVYLSFCDEKNLEYTIENCNLVKTEKIYLCVKSEEYSLNNILLYDLFWRLLRKHDINVNFE